VAREKFQYPSNAEMVDYLYSKEIGYHPRSQNPAEREKYLKRLYRGAKNQEASGEEFSRAKARGHKPRVEHVAKKKYVDEQYRVTGTKKKPLDQADLRDLRNKANPETKAGGRKTNRIRYSITGKIFVPSKKKEEVRTFGGVTTVQSWENFANDFPDTRDFAEHLSGLPWIEVYSINIIAY